ncbi:MAG: MATE family efflux transporter [Chloroflexi bacterium]|nr:MATE family efflux transporter [Chloroflexota bacterium]
MSTQTKQSTQSSAFAKRVVSEINPLISLAVPLIIGLTTSTLPGLVDTAMLSWLGAPALGAVSLTSSLLLIFYAGLYGFVGPVGILVGQAYGANQPGKVGQVIRHAIVIALLAGLISTGLMLLGLMGLPFVGQPSEVLDVINPYWISMSLSLIPYVLLLVFKQLYDAIDRPWLGLWLTLVAVVSNIFLNWLLIYGNLGFPQLGLLGAGLGSLLGQGIGLLGMILHYQFAPEMAEYRQADGEPWSLLAFREQLREGTPMALQYVFEGGAVAVAGILIGWLGAVELAANQIVNSVSSMLYMLPLGMAGAVTIRVAQAAGAGERKRLPPITIAALGLTTLWTSAFTILLLIEGDSVATLFVSDAQLIATAALTFTAVALMQVFDGLQSVSLGALRGILDNRWPTVVSLIGYWLIALPASYVLGVALEGGAAGVWFGFAVGLVVASIMLIARIRTQFKRLAESAG